MSVTKIIEIAQQVASHVWMNYLNVVAETDFEFPILQARKGRLTSNPEHAKDDYCGASNLSVAIWMQA